MYGSIRFSGRRDMPRMFKYSHKRTHFQNGPFAAIREEPKLMDYFDNPFMDRLDYGVFPDNIRTWIWSSVVNGTYRLLCRLNNLNYAYFEARHGYTGYDYHDLMRIAVSPRLLDILNYVMTEKVYETYIQDTHPCLEDCIEEREEYSSNEEEAEKDESGIVFTPKITRADYDTLDGIPSPKPEGNPYQKIIVNSKK